MPRDGRTNITCVAVAATGLRHSWMNRGTPDG